MSQPSSPQPRFDVRGAVDLAALGRPAAPPPGAPGGLPPAGGFVVDIAEATFPDLVQSSMDFPVVVLLWSSRSPESIELAAGLGALAAQYAGRFQLARVDIDVSPQIATAFQVQQVPTVVAILAGQPVPLFQGAYPPAQIAPVLDQLLAAAATNGVTGTAPGGPDETAVAEPAEIVEPPLPPLHQAAYDAIENDDLQAAIDAYSQALRENPRDDMARAGLAQVGLLQRTAGVNLAAARTAAADGPADIDAQLLVADLDVLGGNVDDAFARLVDLVRATTAEDRERVRVRLVDLFEVVGADDPRVPAARRALANALY
ncbi:tetratricopeptide repeat protein [Pengzhenrongella frigida]|uniref:Tetratricopeptide repeat protein n=1 Tax=Pengzhenrongella frigida TaxID=1259133 RepID=A0A4V1ZH36_9MICO|nr:tetratricopeptide repeat protein [Cellulomonas sp. HLT2-17]RYV50674.1 tetratricopeptide repeat protein [Cellulomonas sp. HLT2-17]